MKGFVSAILEEAKATGTAITRNRDTRMKKETAS
jgi:hypothetical protein